MVRSLCNNINIFSNIIPIFVYHFDNINDNKSAANRLSSRFFLPTSFANIKLHQVLHGVSGYVMYAMRVLTVSKNVILFRPL